MNRLSVILICKNEEKNIEACLKSVSFADEIIILDSGSTDKTIEIAKKYTSHVYSTDWPGFGIQKNRCLSKATGDWVLSIDADEQVSDALKEQIIRLLKNPEKDVNGYAIKRLSSYCGKILKYGSWRNDYCTRLFKRGTGHFTNDIVHEKLCVNGTVKQIKAPLYHEAFKTLEEVLKKVDLYSSLGASKRFESGKQGGLYKALSHSIWHFLFTYIFRLGFLDGREGLLLAISNAEGIYYRYMKLYYLHRQKCLDNL